MPSTLRKVTGISAKQFIPLMNATRRLFTRGRAQRNTLNNASRANRNPLNANRSAQRSANRTPQRSANRTAQRNPLNASRANRSAHRSAHRSAIRTAQLSAINNPLNNRPRSHRSVKRSNLHTAAANRANANITTSKIKPIMLDRIQSSFYENGDEYFISVISMLISNCLDIHGDCNPQYYKYLLIDGIIGDYLVEKNIADIKSWKANQSANRQSEELFRKQLLDTLVKQLKAAKITVRLLKEKINSSRLLHLDRMDFHACIPMKKFIGYEIVLSNLIVSDVYHFYMDEMQKIRNRASLRTVVSAAGQRFPGFNEYLAKGIESYMKID